MCVICSVSVVLVKFITILWKIWWALKDVNYQLGVLCPVPVSFGASGLLSCTHKKNFLHPHIYWKTLYTPLDPVEYMYLGDTIRVFCFLSAFWKLAGRGAQVMSVIKTSKTLVALLYAIIKFVISCIHTLNLVKALEMAFSGTTFSVHTSKNCPSFYRKDTICISALKFP